MSDSTLPSSVIQKTKSSPKYTVNDVSDHLPDIKNKFCQLDGKNSLK